jgi:hypothetical protein
MFGHPEYLPDDWLVEIGRVTQSWATFEQLFNLMLQKLAGFDDPFDPTFTILVAHSSMPQRLDMFASLCAAYVDRRPYLAKYREVIGQIREAQAARNRFTHNTIVLDEANPERAKISLISARGKLKQEFQSIGLSNVMEASELINKAGRSLYLLVLDPEWARKS